MNDPEKFSDLDRLAFEMAPIGIVLSENGVIRACNPEFIRMFGLNRETVIDQSISIIYPSFEEFVRIRNIQVKPLRETGLFSDERIMSRADGTLFWCRVRGRTLTSEGDPLARAVWSIADLSRIRPITELSKRERLIIRNLIDGKTSKEIARILDMSPRTVEAHRSRLLSKFGAANVVELMTRLGSSPV
jgi:PAS domain S-box-containing protein